MGKLGFLIETQFADGLPYIDSNRVLFVGVGGAGSKLVLLANLTKRRLIGGR